MILSFRDRKVEQFFRGGRCPREWIAIERTLFRKLALLDDAMELRDLGQLPGNRLEALKGNRKGQHSIRINDQWRICFRWSEKGPQDVEVVDYH